MVSSRHQIQPRGVKRKMSNCPSRPKDYTTVEYDPETTVQILK